MVCKYFLPFHRLPFHFVNDFLCCAEHFLVWCNSTYLFFAFVVKLKQLITLTNIQKLTHTFSFKSVAVSDLMLKSLIHFQLIFVYGIRYGYNFVLLHMEIQFSQHHLLKRLSFPHCILWASPLKITWMHHVLLYFWALYSVLLVYIYVFMPAP